MEYFDREDYKNDLTKEQQTFIDMVAELQMYASKNKLAKQYINITIDPSEEGYFSVNNAYWGTDADKPIQFSYFVRNE